jgi:ketosteroid isomerase-like protein
MEAIRSLYADDVESVEAGEVGGFARVTKGKQAVIEKNDLWGANNEVHSAVTEGPYPHGDSKFAVRFAYDLTNKASGRRMQMDEVAVFTVADGKVVKEEFFYDLG